MAVKIEEVRRSWHSPWRLRAIHDGPGGDPAPLYLPRAYTWSMVQKGAGHALHKFKLDEDGCPRQHVSHLRQDIRLWLEEYLPWGSWREELPGDHLDRLSTKTGRLGILFRHANHAALFKLTWG